MGRMGISGLPSKAETILEGSRHPGRSRSLAFPAATIWNILLQDPMEICGGSEKLEVERSLESPHPGVITEFPLSNPDGYWIIIRAMTPGPDGNVWFLESRLATLTVGKITNSGVVTLYTLPGVGISWGLVAGPDGNMWMINPLGPTMLRLTTAGVMTSTTAPVGGAFTTIALGPDGNLWMTEIAGSIVRVVINLTTPPNIAATPRHWRCGPTNKPMSASL